MNPLELLQLHGVENLAFTTVLCVAALVLRWLIRRTFTHIEPRRGALERELTPAEVGFLVGGGPRAALVGVVELARAGGCVLRPARRFVGTTSTDGRLYLSRVDRRANYTGLGKAADATIGASPTNEEARRLEAHEVVQALRVGLEREGLLVDTTSAARAAALSSVPMFVVLVFMFAKVILADGRPVGVLAVMMTMWLLAIFFVLSRRHLRTRAGDLVLARQRRQNPPREPGLELLPTALYGLTALPQAWQAPLKAAGFGSGADGSLFDDKGSSSSSSSSSCGGGGDGGGGGGACGG